jgi:hypothetical protein
MRQSRTKRGDAVFSGERRSCECAGNGALRASRSCASASFSSLKARVSSFPSLPPLKSSKESEAVSFGESMAASARLLSVLVLTLGLVVIQLLIGGARMVFGFPGYFLIGLSGVLLLFSQVSGRIQRSSWPCFASVLLFGAYIIGRSLESPIDYLSRTDFYMTIGALVVYAITALHFCSPRWRVGVDGSFGGVCDRPRGCRRDPVQAGG